MTSARVVAARTRWSAGKAARKAAGGRPRPRPRHRPSRTWTSRRRRRKPATSRGRSAGARQQSWPGSRNGSAGPAAWSGRRLVGKCGWCALAKDYKCRAHGGEGWKARSRRFALRTVATCKFCARRLATGHRPCGHHRHGEKGADEARRITIALLEGIHTLKGPTLVRNECDRLARSLLGFALSTIGETRTDAFDRRRKIVAAP